MPLVIDNTKEIIRLRSDLDDILEKIIAGAAASHTRTQMLEDARLGAEKARIESAASIRSNLSSLTVGNAPNVVAAIMRSAAKLTAPGLELEKTLVFDLLLGKLHGKWATGGRSLYCFDLANTKDRSRKGGGRI